MRNHDPKHRASDPAPIERESPGERSARIEPSVDPDGREQLAHEWSEAPHPATRFDAGTGQGTVSAPREGAFQERPILDGSTQSNFVEATVPNPYRGERDPSRISDQPALNTTSTNRWMFASVVAAVIVVVALFALFPWSPVWCTIGITFALVGLLAMLAVRASPLGLKARLRIDAVLMALIWLVPLIIILTVMLTNADEIW